jgi:hypothetical protein
MRVLWRFRVVVALGVVLGLLLAIVAVVRIDFVDGSPKLTARTPVEWVSTSMMQVTQPGFPDGYSQLGDTLATPQSGLSGQTQPRFSDPTRYSLLTGVYVLYAKSDPLERVVLRGTGPNTRYDPLTVKSDDGSTVLPFIAMAGYGPSAEAAELVANRATAALQRYVSQRQVRAGIPPDKRTVLLVTSPASKAEVFKPRSLVRPIFLFLVPVLLAVGLAFMLENLRPRKRPPGEVHRVTPREEAQIAPREEEKTERERRTA